MCFNRLEIYPAGNSLSYGDSFRTLVLNASECSTSGHLLSHVQSFLRATGPASNSHARPSHGSHASFSSPSPAPGPGASSRPLPASAWTPLVRALERWHAVVNGSLDPSAVQFANASEQPPALRSPAGLPSAPSRPHRFSAALVVQTHKRVQFMRHLLDSLSQVCHTMPFHSRSSRLVNKLL